MGSQSTLLGAKVAAALLTAALIAVTAAGSSLPPQPRAEATPPRAALQPTPAPKDGPIVFAIGAPDESAEGFGLGDADYTSFTTRFPGPVEYVVGKSTARDWPFIHPSSRDGWAGGKAHTFTIRFAADAGQVARPLNLFVGMLAAWEPSQITVAANGREIASRRLPDTAQRVELAFDPRGIGVPTSLAFAVPAGTLQPGENTIAITLDQGSWMVYDYVQLTAGDRPPSPAAVDLRSEFLAGPLADVQHIVFAVRKPGLDGHWYANFAYDANDPAIRMYQDGGRLCRLNLRSGKVTVLLDDPQGGVRDPHVSYDASHILFSYRKGGTANYHLYEIRADGTGLRQITDGPFDDIEPTYMPDDTIVFVSSRCKRWVNCWRTPVAVMYRCSADGSNIRQISANIEHDNTPWPMPDGRLLYTRWEYIDRSQVHYHHLWTADPDGSAHMAYYGNQVPGTVMIDAKPIPGSGRAVCVFSPGHGMAEHTGAVYTVDPGAGPDAPRSARRISRTETFRDPWAFSEGSFMAATGPELRFMNARGATECFYRLPEADIRAGFEVQEPRPLVGRDREHILADRAKPGETTGQMVLANVYSGRNMAGVKPGDIRKLLILESLPKPVNFTGGMEPLSYGGTFTLERVLGTVPIEADGSACFEVPAMRSVFFVALDANDMPVKRMQSFASAMPGETIGCVGCHEQRERIAAPSSRVALLALARPASRIQPIADVPDVLGFTRDIQPILDRRCLSCHDWSSRQGGVVLSGDRGPFYNHSYFELFAHDQVSDGRNRPRSNYAPRTIGSVASPLMKMLEPAHHGVQATELERKTVRLWIDSGAPHAGTYATLETGMVGGYSVNALDRGDLAWPATQAAQEVMRRRCASCHTGARALPTSVSDDQNLPPWVEMGPNDPRRRYANHLIYNLSRPDKSILLLGPLAKSAGGYGSCGAKDVFASTSDPDYVKLLASVEAARQQLDTVKRFDMPGFRPHPGWVREMQRYGILPATLSATDPIDVYATERKYWESLWCKPAK